MKNYIYLGIQILAIVLCSMGVVIVDSTFLQILDIVAILIDTVGICIRINFIVSDAISKYDDEHYIRYHMNNNDKE